MDGETSLTSAKAKRVGKTHACPRDSEDMRRLFLENFSGPKSQLSNRNPLVLNAFNVRKTKRIAKFYGLEP